MGNLYLLFTFSINLKIALKAIKAVVKHKINNFFKKKLARELLQPDHYTLKKNYYYFLAALDLHCCVRPFSICAKEGLFSSCDVWASHCAGFLLQNKGSRACGLQQLQPTALAALQYVKSSQTREQTHVPCNGRRICNH